LEDLATTETNNSKTSRKSPIISPQQWQIKRENNLTDLIIGRIMLIMAIREINRITTKRATPWTKWTWVMSTVKSPKDNTKTVLKDSSSNNTTTEMTSIDQIK